MSDRGDAGTRVPGTPEARDRYSSSQAGTLHGYRLEARSKMGPRVVAKIIIGTEWTAIPTTRGEAIANPILNCIADEQGVLAYSTALAFAAELDAALGFASCVEFRLVRVELKYEWKIKMQGASAPWSFWDEERATDFVAAPSTGAPDPNG